MRQELTHHQRQAVESKALRVCVEAGPGSGKTRVLVARLAHGVESKRLRLDRILALTFTENAAAEMKSRLARQFTESGLQEQRRQVEQADVSTIHGFCARLLREHAIEAGVDPRFQVLDELEAGLLQASMMEKTLNALQKRDPGAFEEFARHFQRPMLGSLLQAYDIVCHASDDPGNLGLLLETRHNLEEVLKGFVERFTVLQKGVHGRNDKYSEAAAAIQRGLDRACGSGGLEEKAAALQKAAKAINLQRLSDAFLKPAFKTLRGSLLDELMPAIIESGAAPHRRRIAEVLVEFHHSYTGHKQRISALDFHDLEVRASKLLSKDDDGGRDARAPRRDLQEILVDEYQDTSRLQAEILERLGRDTTMFVVGDPKQSIYAFRNADPRNFTEALKKADAVKGVVPLREDFRSRPEIIAAVNSYFLTVWPENEGLPLEAGGKFDAKENPSVELVLYIGADRDAEARRREESRHLARRIRELIEKGGLRITKRGHDRYGQTLEYGDVAMLFRSTSDMMIYEQALQQEDLPYYAETGRGFYDAREVADVVNFLRLLDNARDEVALASVLRSPLCGLSDDALYALAAPDRAKKPAAAGLLIDSLQGAEKLAMPEGDLERLLRFRESFTRLREEALRRPLDSLIEEIVAVTGYEATLLPRSNGARRVANLRKLAAMARTFGGNTTGLDSLGSFVRAADHFRQDGVREGEAQLAAAPECAAAGRGIRLMTMHAAKGLESPVVVLPDLSRAPASEHAEVDYANGYGLGFKYDCGNEKLETLTLKNIRDRRKTDEDQEEFRVLFVAMTRAMEHLVLSGTAQVRKDGSLGSMKRLEDIRRVFQLSLNLGRKTETVSGQHPFEMAVLVTDQVEKKAAFSSIEWEVPVFAAEEDRLESLSYSSDQADFVAGVTDVMEFESCPRRYYLGRYLGFGSQPSKPRPATMGEPDEEEDQAGQEAGDEFPAIELGTAVHKLLAGQPGPFPQEVVELARRFHESDLGRRVAAMKDVKHEEPIFGAVDGHILRGILDLRAGPLIVDYKAGAEATERYRLQMLLYGLLTGAKEAWLFYLKDSLAVPIELAPQAQEEARAAVGRLFDAQRTLDFPAVVADHCFPCPFSGRQCREPQRQKKARQAGSSE